MCSIALFSLVTLVSLGQSNPCFSALEALQEGIRLHDEGQYDAAVAKYREVQQGDTLYILALYEEGLSLIENKQYTEAIAPLERCLQEPFDDRVMALINLGIAHDHAGNLDRSLAYFAQAEREYPYNNMVHYNRAITLLRAKRGDEALADLQKSVQLNPKHPATHLRLGYLAAANGGTTQAALALNTFLALEPSGERAFIALRDLEGILMGTFTPEEKVKADIHPNRTDDFAELDLVLANKVSLRDKYKYPHKKVDVKVLRQTHLLLNEFTYNPDDKGFWMQTYGPVVASLQSTGRVNDFLLLMVANFNSYEKQLAKRINSIKECMSHYHAELVAAVAKKPFPSTKGVVDNLTVSYYDRGAVMSAVEKVNGIKNGHAEYYFSNGRVEAVGAFKANERHGHWKIYHASGALKEEYDYVNGKIEGDYTSYNEHGILTFQGRVSNNALNGKVRYFDEQGWLTVELGFANGKPDGERLEYYQNGQVSERSTYVEGVQQGAFVSYHPNGEVLQEATLVDGKLHGESKWYYSGKRLAATGNYANGDLEGEYVAYYSNGTVKERSEQKNGQLVGVAEEFHPNGKLKKRTLFDTSTDETATMEYYDYNGVKIEVQNMLKNEIRSFQQLADDGSVIYENKKKGGKFYYKDYRGDGIMTQEGEFDANNGNQIGVWKSYDANGALSSEFNYVAGKLVGAGVDYFPNGNTKSAVNYVEGEYSGDFKTYYFDGARETEGCYANGLTQGQWVTYHEDGSTLYSERYFVNGKLNGDYTFFDFEGGLHEKQLYRMGDKLLTILYRLDGQADTLWAMQLGEHPTEVYYPNGQLRTRVTRINGMANGLVEWFYPNGKPMRKGMAYNDRSHGEWVYYYPNGKVSRKETYEFGDLDGVRTYYDEDGKVTGEYVYMADELNGNYKAYVNGVLTRTGSYVNGLSHGMFDYYSSTGKLQQRRDYYHDRIRAVGQASGSESKIVWTQVESDEQTIETVYANGKKARSYSLKKGELHGPLVVYHDNGNKQLETTYSHGQETGVSRSYYADGKPDEEEFYLNGQRHGEQKAYYPNGKLKSIQNYKHGSLDGEAIYYDKNGKKIAHFEYRMGTPFNSKQ